MALFEVRMLMMQSIHLLLLHELVIRWAKLLYIIYHINIY